MIKHLLILTLAVTALAECPPLPPELPEMSVGSMTNTACIKSWGKVTNELGEVGLEISVDCVKNRTYQVQFATSLNPPVLWFPRTTYNCPSSGRAFFFYSLGDTYPRQAYFRVLHN